MDIDAYLRRIDAKRPDEPTVEALRELHKRHLETVPFENLSVHLPERIELTEDALFDKIVRRRRGGFCYELNGAFAALLRELGFEVTLLSARVFRPGAPPAGPASPSTRTLRAAGLIGSPFDHLALRVDLDEPWLVDVGFGRHALYPLRLNACEPQLDPDGEFLVLDTPEGEVDVLHDGKPVYRLDRRAHELADFVPTCWWQATAPGTTFTRSLTCSLATPTGRITLSGDRLIETVDGERTERILADDEILSAYQAYFGIELADVPVLGSFPAPGHQPFPN